MKLSIGIKFNKDMTNEIPPSLGGFYVKDRKGNKYGFDFNTSEYGINTKNPYLVDYVLKDEDLDTFHEINQLKNHLMDLTDWNEIYMDYEGGTSEDVEPVAIEYLEITQYESRDSKRPHYDTLVNDVAIKTIINEIATYTFHGKFLDKALKSITTD